MAALFLHFPDGRLTAPVWRHALRFAVLGGTLCALVLALMPGPLDTVGIENPLGAELLRPLRGSGPTLRGPAGWLFVLPLTALAASTASAIGRFLRSDGDTRQQLKWLAVSAAFCTAMLALTSVTPDKIGQFMVLAGFTTAPIAIGIAILRHRLYEIDTIINAALVYGLLTALLAGGFAATQEILKRLFVTASGDTSEGVVVATLFVIATLFAPARSSLQRLVDTRFHPASAAAVAAAASPVARALRELAQLHEDGIVTDVEFNRKRGELLARM